MKETMKVLVVDDDRRMVKTICDVLAINGYETVQAYTGLEAVEKVKSVSPDCVLMDLKMPGMDGVEALTMIRALAPSLPVVLMSAHATEEQVEEVRRQGGVTVLTKPIDLQRILSFLSLLKRERSILVVDDDEDFSRMLTLILHATGYRVESEADPEKVLDHMEGDSKQVVLLDLKLGTADGLQVLQDIRARYPTKPVVLVTGYGPEMCASIRKGMEIGAHACLYKPFEARDLIGIIEDIRRGRLRSLLQPEDDAWCRVIVPVKE